MERQIVLDDATLAHYGIKGMKWGKRKARIVKRLTPKPVRRKRLNQEIRTLSDKELQNRINRLQNEERYRELKGVSKKKSNLRKNMRNKTDEAIASALTMPIKVAAGVGGAYAAKLIKDHGRDAINAAATVYALNNLKK